MAEKEPQDDDGKGKKQASKFKSFEPTTRKFTKTKDETESNLSEFQFIPVTDPQNASGSTSTRKAVRSYVMRKFHKEKQSEASGKRKRRDFLQTSTTSSRVTQDVSMSGVQSFEPIELPFRIPNQENWYEQAEEEAQLTTAIDKALEAELSANYCPSLPGSVLMIMEPVPPLITKFPVPQDSMRHVHFSVTMVNKYLAPMTPSAQSRWFTVVTSNVASFHATVLLSLTTQAQMRRIPLPSECFYHSSEAVRHINSKLQDPEEQCSDETINAIATLVMFESFVTQGSERSIHLDGLETVLNLRRQRGGVEVDATLMDFVQCVDQHISASNDIPTRLTHSPPSPAPLTLPSLNPTTSTPSFLLPFSPNNFPLLSPQNNLLFNQIRHLSPTMIHLYTPHFSPATQHAYIKSLLSMQTQLSSAYKYISDPREKVWYHTTVLYTFLVLRKIPFTSAAVWKMVVRMRFAVETLLAFSERGEGEEGTRNERERESQGRCEKEMLLWTTMLGGVASVGKEVMYGFWQGLLARLREEMGLNRWEEAREILRSWGWVEYICEPVCRVFWEVFFGGVVFVEDDGGDGGGKGKGKEVVS